MDPRSRGDVAGVSVDAGGPTAGAAPGDPSGAIAAAAAEVARKYGFTAAEVGVAALSDAFLVVRVAGGGAGERPGTPSPAAATGDRPCGPRSSGTFGVPRILWVVVALGFRATALPYRFTLERAPREDGDTGSAQE